MTNKLIQLKTLKLYIRKKEITKIRQLFANHQIIDLASLVNHLKNPQDIIFIFKTCSSDHTA